MSTSETRQWRSARTFAERYSTTIAAGLTLIAAILGVFVAVAADDLEPPVGSEASRAMMNDLGRQQRLLQEDLDRLESQLAALEQPTPATQASAQIAAMDRSVVDLRGQVEALNAAIVEDPEKALAVPILRRDLDSLRSSTTDSIRVVQADLGRQYDLMRWVLGTFIFGLLTLIVTSLVGAKKA